MKTFYRRVARSSTQSCAEEKPESVNERRYCLHSFADSCITFVFFVLFVVKTVFLCVLCVLCELCGEK